LTPGSEGFEDTGKRFEKIQVEALEDTRRRFEKIQE